MTLIIALSQHKHATVRVYGSGLVLSRDGPRTVVLEPFIIFRGCRLT